MEKVIVILGSGRSGTTWIQDSIAQANGMKTLFEPLHPIGVPKAKRFAFRFVPADSEEPELKAFMDIVFSGRMKSLWAEYRVRPDRFNIRRYGIRRAIYRNVKMLLKHYFLYRANPGNGLVVKFIRANLMLPWLARTYNLPMLYVIRHPCAVVTSRLRHTHPDSDWAFEKTLSQYTKDQALKGILLNQSDIDLEKPMSPAAGLACIWCIENVLPLRWMKEFNYTMVAYESLLMKPEQEWQRIVEALKLDNIPSTDLVEQPSQQAFTEIRNKRYNSSHLGQWQRELSEKKIEEIDDILKRFGLTYYNVIDPMPRLTSVV